MKVDLTDREGNCRPIEWKQGDTLMAAIRASGVEFEAVCDGTLSCATCHVYITAPGQVGLPDPDADEVALLESLDGLRPGQSRLSCQIAFADNRDDLRVTVAPSE